MPLTKYRRKNPKTGKLRENWYIKGTVRGIAFPERSTGTGDAKAAEALRVLWESELLNRSVFGDKATLTFAEAATRYMQAGGERRFLAKVLTSRIGTMKVAEIDQYTIDEVGRDTYPSVKPATMRRQWHTPVIAVIRHADPERSFTRPKGGGKRTDFLTPPQMEAVIENCSPVLINGAGKTPNPWARALPVLLVGQGLRVSEAINLDPTTDLNLEYNTITVRRSKNGHERTMRMLPRVKAQLMGLPNLREKGPLIRKPGGGVYVAHQGRGHKLTVLRNAIEAAGLDRSIYTPHTLRHTWATWFFAINKDVVRLCDEGGWLSDEWRRYTKLATPELAADVIKYGWTETVEPSWNLQEVGYING
eukprot:s1_g2089.t1